MKGDASCSPKRARSGADSPSSSAKKRRLSSPEGTVRDSTLRIVAETLRGENRQLLQDRDVLEKEKSALQERLKKAQRSLRELEDDMARVYRHQKELGAKKLQGPAGLKASKEIKPTVLFSEQTTAEMDRFLESCGQWQSRLARMSNELQVRVEKLGEQEMQGVLRDLVTSVELEAWKTQMQAQEMELQWALLLQADAAIYLKEMYSARQDTEAFEAMEKQLMDDRVVELETQLAQKRAVEREKEMELSSLRADQEEIMHSSRVVPNEEFATLEAAQKATSAELQQLKALAAQQKAELQRADDECASLKERNKMLAEEARQLREKQESSDLEVAKLNVTQEEEVKKLHAQLQAAKAKETGIAAALKGAEREREKGRQRKEELKILYAKFSSAMDSVSEKSMRLEELEQELKDAQSKARDMQRQTEQLARLEQERADRSAAQHLEKDSMGEELAKAQTQCAELQALASQQKQLAASMEADIAELQAQNEALKAQQVKKEHQSVGQPSIEGDRRRTPTCSEDALVAQVAEKEALQRFLQCYYSAAEEKCSRLLRQVSELEAHKAALQEQTKASCSALRTCTDSCDGSVRASLLDAMAKLEGLT
jgi:hypothetical protein